MGKKRNTPAENRIDLKGQRFGRLMVSDFSRTKVCPNGCFKPMWVCVCDCGNTKEVVGQSLRNGYTRSCGCFRRETTIKRSLSHGDTKCKEHYTWLNIKHRCNNKGNIGYASYGGRGITMCQEWLNSYETFLSDMGRAPGKGYSIERIDNNGNYEPSNCKWATQEEQANNRRNTIFLELNGVRKALKYWAQDFGFSSEKLKNLIIKAGKTIDEIALEIGYDPKNSVQLS